MTKITWASTQDFVTYLICKAHLKAHADISIFARSKCWSEFSSTSKFCVCEQQDSDKTGSPESLFMHRSRKFCQRGSNFDSFFLVYKGSEYHYRQAIICQWWPNIECWLGSFVIFQGIWTSIAKKPYIFVIFQGGPDPLSPPPPLGPCMVLLDNAISTIIMGESSKFPKA